MEFELPADLTTLDDGPLSDLLTEATGYFKELAASEPTGDVIKAMTELKLSIKALRTETKRRTDLAAANAEEQAKLIAELDEDGDGDEDETDDEDDETDDGEPVEDAVTEPVEPVVEDAVEPIAASAKHDPVDDLPKTRKINLPKSQRKKVEPIPGTEDTGLTITASADIPGVRSGATVDSVEKLAEMLHRRARQMSVTHDNPNYVPIATVHNSFANVVDEKTSPDKIEEMFDSISNVDDMVAAGGWCAPSEIRYSFFDLVCDDGEIDLPTFGVNRGGIRWPTSATLADVYGDSFVFGNTTNPWLWTESDDISAATGSLTKPCVRVPCPDFNERRLECYGLCVTAGNLMSDAYPEAIAHQIGLLRSAYFHAINARYIATMVGLSGTVITGAAGTFGAASGSTASDLPGYVEWAAIDLRTRYGMCDGDVVEVVLPRWTKAVIRQDLARKNGLDLFAVTDEYINNFFDVRGVRVQWVGDWQVRGTDQPGGATPTLAYPASVDFMMYPAGTFGLGNGLTLDLGVVRDSTLNAKNDHTALWAEECHLIAKFGPVSRLYRHNLCAGGRSGLVGEMGCL